MKQTSPIGPTGLVETAIYLLNQKRQTLCALEQRYKMEIVICADDSIKNVTEFRLERVKSQKETIEEKKTAEETTVEETRIEENTGRRGRRRNDRRQMPVEEKGSEKSEETINQENAPNETENNVDESAENSAYNNNGRRGRRDRRDRRRDRRGRDRRRDRNDVSGNRFEAEKENHKEKAETIILYNSHEDIKSNTPNNQETDEKQGKTNWWRKLIG